jgi:hypothetical protein
MLRRALIVVWILAASGCASIFGIEEQSFDGGNGDDGSVESDGALDANADRGVVADAANDAGSDGIAAMDGTVDAELDGTIAADASGDTSDAGDAAMEAGAQDASTQDGAPSEAGTPTDAAEDSPEASTCTLSAVSATPFPQLSGIADVTGTVVTATGAVTMGPAMNCIAGVTTPTSGALLFAFNSTDCYFSYQDASGGTVFTSTIGDTGFDGDTYVCSFSGGWGLTAPNMGSFEPACPELSIEPGVNASVSLAVTRSTGAVTVSRQCVDNGVAQYCAWFPNSAGGVQSTELAVSGSLLSCAAPGAGGQILCGTTSCSVESQVCCLGSIAAPAIFCSDTTADCLAAGVEGTLRGAIACSGPESCGPGEVCCGVAAAAEFLEYPGSGWGLLYQCQLATTCPAGSPVVCESNADCPAGETCSTAEPGICGP